LEGIDFRRYSVEELHQALASIDAEKYPENYAKLLAELAKPERQLEEREAVRADENASQETKKILVRIFSVSVGVCSFFLVYYFFSEGVVHLRHGRILVSQAENPLGFYLWLAFFVYGGFLSLYMGFTGKGFKEKYK